MTTAMLEKRVRALEEKIEVLEKQVIKGKKLPVWLQAGLKDVEEGRISGPFNTVEKLMEHLEK